MEIKNLVLTSGINILIDEYVFENHNSDIYQADDLFGMQVVGSTIESIHFEHNEVVKCTTHYGQPIIYLCFDNGAKIRFTHNFGEVKNGNVVSYFTIEMN